MKLRQQQTNQINFNKVTSL